MKDLKTSNKTNNIPDISGFDTIVAYRHLRQQLPDCAFIMPLQLSLSPHSVRLEKDRHYGNHIVTTLAALTGATGCLPPYYEETALYQALNRNHSYADFIALFQRHLADYLIGAAAKYRTHRQSRWKAPANNPFLKTISAIAGCGLAPEKDRQQTVVTHFATLFADSRRNAASLKAMLEEIFKIPVRIKEFRPCWQPIPAEDRCFLNGQYQLGINSFIGFCNKNAASHFRLVLGPLHRSLFRRFLPDQPLTQKLCRLTRLYCGMGLHFDVQLVMHKTGICADNSRNSARLGYDLWLATTTPDEHRDDAIFREQTILTTAQQDMKHAS